ncbi:MAG: hypothetical protein ACK5XN_00850 [Bacteroidota bacterium]
MKNWESSNRIHVFIAAVQASSAVGKEDFASFLAWADTYAYHLDPTNEFRIEVLDDARFFSRRLCCISLLYKIYTALSSLYTPLIRA